MGTQRRGLVSVPEAASNTSTGGPPARVGCDAKLLWYVGSADPCDEFLQVGLGPGAVVADDLCGGDRRQLTAYRQRLARGKAGKEARSIGVACAGCVHYAGRLRGDLHRLAATQDDAARFAAGERRQCDIGPGAFRGGLKTVLLVEAGHFSFVGKKDFDVVLHQLQEVGAMPI